MFASGVVGLLRIVIFVSHNIWLIQFLLRILKTLFYFILAEFSFLQNSVWI